MNKNNHTANIPMEEYLQLVKLKEQDEFNSQTLSKAMFELIKGRVLAGGGDLGAIRLPYTFETESFIFRVDVQGRHGNMRVTYQFKPDAQYRGDLP